MSAIDWPTFVNWSVQGLISLVCGVIGGYIGAWLQFGFTRRLEQERVLETEQRALRTRLTEGVSELVEKAEKAALEPLGVLKRFSLNLLTLAAVVMAFVFSPWAGLVGLFLFGLLLGARART